jgi:iron complex outermembrane recepter protein
MPACKRPSMRIRAGLLACAAIVIGPVTTSQALAQDAAPDAGQASVGFEEIVVTAQKRSENVQNVPLAITAVRGETLEALNITQPQQLSIIDPSVRYKQSLSSGASGLTIRGVGTSSFSAGIEQSISTVVDGVVFAVPSSLSTLADIERVEILRGPQGMLFGKNASAGLIHFITKRPFLNENSAEVRLQVGNRGERIFRGIGNIAVTDDSALRIVATHNRRDGLIRNLAKGGIDTDPQDVTGLALKYLWEPTADLTVYFAADRTENDAFCCSSSYRTVAPGYAPAVINAQYGIVAGPDNLEIAAGGDAIGSSSTQGASIQIDYALGQHTLTSITALRQAKGENSYDGDMTTVNYIDSNGGANETKWFTQELRITSPPSDTFDYVAGLYFYSSKASSLIRQRGQLNWIVPASRGTVIPVVPGAPLGTVFETTTYNDVDTTSVAAFGQGTWHITPRLDLIAGARVTRDNGELNYRRDPTPGARPIPGAVAVQLEQKVAADNFSWRIGPRYDFTDDIMGYATVSRGYKGPGFSGLSAASATADQRIEPEIPTSYELGIKSAFFDRHLVANLALYHTVVRDFQAQVSDLSSATYSSRITNAGEIRIKGAELNLLARPTPDLTVTAGGAYTDARYEDFNGVQCYFGQPKVAEGGPCTAPPANPNSIDGFFNAAGLPLSAVAKWVFGTSAVYEREVSNSLRLALQANWNWQSDINFAPSGDPGTIQEAYGLLGGRVAIEDRDGRWSLALHGSNLLDKRFAAMIAPSPSTALNPGGYVQYFSPDSVRRISISLDIRL